MKLEDQVCSLKLAKRLKELGVKQNGYFTWHRMNHTAEYEVIVTTLTDVPKSSRGWAASDFSTFTVAELGEMMPISIEGRQLYCTKVDKDFGNCWWVGYERVSPSEKQLCVGTSIDTEADARAKMLIYLVENKVVKL